MICRKQWEKGKNWKQCNNIRHDTSNLLFPTRIHHLKSLENFKITSWASNKNLTLCPIPHVFPIQIIAYVLIKINHVSRNHWCKNAIGKWEKERIIYLFLRKYKTISPVNSVFQRRKLK